MDIQERVDRTSEAADAIGKAVSAHFGGTIDVYAVLGGLSTIAADIIMKAPRDVQAELLEAWDETPAYVRAQVRGKQ